MSPRRQRIRVTVIPRKNSKYLYMRYRNTETGEEETRSTGETDRREAERAAAKWEAELEEARYIRPGRTLWVDFRLRYEAEVLQSLSANTDLKAQGVLNAVERLIEPQRLENITAGKLSRFQADLREDGAAESTIAGYLKHLKAALRWAKRVGLLVTVPEFPIIRRAKTGRRSPMKGRPLTDQEFAKLVKAVPKVVDKADVKVWQFYLRGMWLSGLRLEESLKLWWDSDAGLRVIMAGRDSLLKIPADDEKGVKDRLMPLVPEFQEFLAKVPRSERTGLVFKIPSRLKRQPIKTTVSRIGCEIGKAAKILVDERKQKYASIQDLRRTFGNRWARRVMPMVLKDLMRHETILTTEAFYVELEAAQTSAILWSAHEKSQGDTSGDTQKRSRRKSKRRKA